MELSSGARPVARALDWGPTGVSASMLSAPNFGYRYAILPRFSDQFRTSVGVGFKATPHAGISPWMSPARPCGRSDKHRPCSHPSMAVSWKNSIAPISKTPKHCSTDLPVGNDHECDLASIMIDPQSQAERSRPPRPNGARSAFRSKSDLRSPGFEVRVVPIADSTKWAHNSARTVRHRAIPSGRLPSGYR
jgi:hypothetical protein